jgi:3-dehydroquinate synthase
MIELTVELGERRYPIFIGSGLIERPELIRPYLGGSQGLIVTNEVVAPLYLERVRQALSNVRVSHIALPDGEAHKTLETFSTIIDALVDGRHDRTTTVIALGGGVVGDIAGFAAACYQRGVRLIQIPTTLLAQVDSSVGGKTAVNHARGKNLIGAFHQPACVIADTDVLGTLPARELTAGVGEIVKYGVIRDAVFFEWLEQHLEALLRLEPEALAFAVRRSCEIKADVVAADERESGLREILNFGHTFGHGLEQIGGYETWLHGEAVALGMVIAADLSVREKLLDRADAKRIKTLLARAGLPVTPPADLSRDALLEAMSRDKKVKDGKVRLVLAKRIGSVKTTDDYGAKALRETLGAGDALCEG